MNALILGTGYIAQAFANAWNVQPLSRSRVNYASPERFSLHLISKPKPSVVVNCAGFTGRPNIDECEVNRRETVEANVVLPANLSRICAANGIPFVHISSGCVFDQGFRGNLPPFHFREDNEPMKNLSFYSRTKVMAEDVITGYALRIRMPFGLEPHPRSLITKLRGYDKLINHPNSLTFIPDLVKATEALLQNKAPLGVYHVANRGYASHSDIARTFRECGIAWNPSFISDEEFYQQCVRAPRSNCVLDCSKLAKFYVMPDVYQRLIDAGRYQRQLMDQEEMVLGEVAA